MDESVQSEKIIAESQRCKTNKRQHPVDKRRKREKFEDTRKSLVGSESSVRKRKWFSSEIAVGEQMTFMAPFWS